MLHESKRHVSFIVSIGVNAVRKKGGRETEGWNLGKAFAINLFGNSVVAFASIHEGTVVMQELLSRQMSG